MESGRGVVSLQKFQDKRLRRGECPTCGIKLYKAGGVLGKKKTPLTVEGRVDHGKCLTCHPPERTGDQLQEEEGLCRISEDHFNVEGDDVPQFLLIEPRVDDSGTAISGITLDQQLRHGVGDEEEDVDDGFDQASAKANPPSTKIESKRTQSLGDQRPPAPQHLVAAKSKQRESTLSKNNNNNEDPILSYPPKSRNHPSTAPPSHQQEDGIEQIAAPTPAAASPAPKRPGLLREIYFDSTRCFDLERHSEKEERKSSETTHSPLQEDIVVLPESLPTSSPQQQSEPRKIESPIGSSKRHAATALGHAVGGSQEEGNVLIAGGYDENILSSLLSSAASSKMPSLDTMQSIINQVWLGGPQAKLLFQKQRGYEFLSQFMWSHMVHEPLEEKAVELLLSTVAFEEEDDGQDSDNFETTAMLVTEQARNAVEALLFVMQSLSHNQNIQITACRALVCLATASGQTEGQVDDGSSSGAAAVILSSMAAHRNSVPVLKWCMRALYELCTISPHAESNKRTVLAASTLDGGGLSVVLDSLQQSVTEAVRLVWCLSASEDARGSLDPSGSVLETIIHMLRKNVKSPAVSLVESLLGAVNNLCVMADDSSVLADPNELMLLAFQAASENKDGIGLCTEAIALIANIAAITPTDKSLFVEIGGIALIAQLVMDNEDAAVLHEECVCAFLSLSIGSDHVKAALRSQPIFAAVKRLCRLYESTIKLQELLCNLLSSIAVTTDAHAESCEKDSIGLICFAMTLHSNPDGERVQEACSIALRNLSFRETSVKEHLIASDAVDLLIEAMSLYVESKIIAMNVCETLWNVGFTGIDYPRQSTLVIPTLVGAVRAHIDDVELLLASLDMFLRILVCSDMNKKLFCDENGIEVATSIMLIHRQTEPLLIKSSGILATLSFVPYLVPAVVDSGGISCTVDTIRSQTTSVDFLTSALQVLTNATLAMPDQSEVVGGIVPVLIERMRQRPSDAQFHGEACRFLRALASLSDDARFKILELGGVAVLLATLEHNREAHVQNNALEAINELAHTTSQVAN